jgi:ATP-dependent exoDNAse (exonuclease V) beta subunit
MGPSENFLVFKSSAGSGKTFNLSKTYLELILKQDDPHAFKRILAITFTVKAASEMKERILTYLSILGGNEHKSRSDTPFMLPALMDSTKLSEQEIKTRSAVRLKAILHQYSDFSVLTIDKFFARLVRSFASDLALSPDFEIQVTTSQFIERVTDLLYEKIGHEDDLTDLILHLLHTRLAEDNGNNADEVIKSACNTLLSDEFYLIRQNFERFTPSEVKHLHITLGQEADAIAAEVKQVGEEVMNLLHQYSVGPEDLANGKNGVYRLFQLVAEGDFSKILNPGTNAVKPLETGKWQSGTKHPAVAELEHQLTHYLESILAKRTAVERYHLLHAVRREVYSLGFYSELVHLFESVKEEDNIRLLSEFNTLIAEQLQKEHADFLFERLGNQYQHILIDEFQDTSTLQWRNLIPLVENSLSEGNLSLIVGDAKQSIFRFRDSDPEQFVNLPQVDLASQALFDAAYHEIVLNQNFRSSQRIVEFNNRFFQLAQSALLSESHQVTYANHAQHHHSNDEGAVRWWIADDKEIKKPDLMQQMLQRVSYLIHDQKASPDSICCLFRQNKDASVFASLLIESGFKVISQESLLLRNNPSIQLLIASYEVLATPTDPFALQRWLSRYHQRTPMPHYHEVAKSMRTEHWNLGKMLHSLRVRFDDLDIHHGDSFSKTLALCKALEIDVNNAFVQKLFDLALTYESKAIYLKQSFLDYWVEMEEKCSIQLPSRTDAISVMTIHKSKGLEFPTTLVFLPELKKVKNTKSMSWVKLEQLNIGFISLKLNDLKSTNFEYLLEEENQRSVLDQLNSTYVAFTRAKNRLEIFSQLPASTSLLHKLKEWPEWNETEGVLAFN